MKILAAATLTSILLITTLIGNLVGSVGANPYFHGGYDPSPPVNAKITIVSPINYTVNPSNLTFNFNVSFVNSTSVEYYAYLLSINYSASWGTENKNVYKWNYYDEYNLDPSNDDPQISEYQYAENMTNVPDGKQKITINVTATGSYIKAWTSYYFYINESQTVSFNVDAAPPTIKVSSGTIVPWEYSFGIVASFVGVVVVGASMVYFKRRKQAELDEHA